MCHNTSNFKTGIVLSLITHSPIKLIMYYTLFVIVIAMSTMERDYTKRDGNGDLKILSEQPKKRII